MFSLESSLVLTSARTSSDVMNEKSVLQVQIYDRSIEEEMFLGMCEIRPRLVNNHTVDQWFPCVFFSHARARCLANAADGAFCARTPAGSSPDQAKTTR